MLVARVLAGEGASTERALKRDEEEPSPSGDHGVMDVVRARTGATRRSMWHGERVVVLHWSASNQWHAKNTSSRSLRHLPLWPLAHPSRYVYPSMPWS